MLLRIARSFLSLFSLFHAAAACALSSDPRLLQLVPPESQVIAGMLSPSTSGQLSSLLLVTRRNELDHKDFFALTGGDPSRSIHEVVFVAASGRGVLSEHSLLVSGHFNRDAIFRLAGEGTATADKYRGVPILAVAPFARERESFRELRWLAIPNERIAIFGSVASVQRELDRWIANTPPDPELLERLSRLDRRDETWCLLPAPRPGGLVASILGKVDANLGALAGEGRSIQYGIHFGKDVEITASNNPVAEPVVNSPVDPPGTESMAVSFFLAGSNDADSVVSKPVRVKVRRQQYARLLADLSRSAPLIDGDPFR